MNNFNLDDLLKELSPDSPCGENVALSPEFSELENEAKFQPERQMGNAIVPEKAPDWKIVLELSHALLQRSRDVQVAMYFATALINIEGFPGLEKGLALINGLLQKYWDKVHPLKDVDDKYPVMLVNTLYALNDAKSILNPLRNFPLATSKIGKISWAVYESTKAKFDAISHLASQEDLTEYKKKNNDKNLPATLEEAKKITNDDFNALIQGLQEADLASLKSTTTSLNNITSLLVAIGETLTEKVGTENAPDFSNLDALAKNIQKLLADAIRSKSPATKDTDEVDDSSSQTGIGEQQQAQAKGYRGDGINSREEVISAIDAICNYFHANEPSSPVPLLLQRAKKLLSMNFMEILQDLTPDAVSQAEKICGVKKNE